jgi:hypothetical protein
MPPGSGAEKFTVPNTPASVLSDEDRNVTVLALRLAALVLFTTSLMSLIPVTNPLVTVPDVVPVNV